MSGSAGLFSWPGGVSELDCVEGSASGPSPFTGGAADRLPPSSRVAAAAAEVTFVKDNVDHHKKREKGFT